MTSLRLLGALLIAIICVKNGDCHTRKGRKNKRNSSSDASKLSETLSTRVLGSKRVLKRNKGLRQPDENGADRYDDTKARKWNKKRPFKGADKQGAVGTDNSVVQVSSPGQVTSPGNLVIPVEHQQFFQSQAQQDQYVEEDLAQDPYFNGGTYWNFPPPDELTIQVVSEPTKRPTNPPTRKPTPTPTARPTTPPTEKPTPAPTSGKPTPAPTPKPTVAPTNWPTPAPTPRPTMSLAQKQAHVQAEMQKKLDGPGCHFLNSDSTITSFTEGQSMGQFSMVDSCANNVPAAFPGYCISTAYNQTVYPYCFFRDAFNQNICGRSGDNIGILAPNRTLLHCKCNVAVTPFGKSYDIKITSNCDMIDFTTQEAPDTLGDLHESDTTATPTKTPTPAPTTVAPTAPPTPQPTKAPVAVPTMTRSPVASGLSPVNTNNAAPVAYDLSQATSFPTFTAQNAPLVPEEQLTVTYQPGNLTKFENGLWLSHGLSSRILSRAGQAVSYTNSIHGTQSQEAFHPWPDGAAVFNDNRPGNSGGWIYVSNSEMKDGGVGATTFNKDGDVIHYRQILYGTSYNCNGGRTPWGSWITAEEDFDNFKGRLWQVDPYGVRQPQPLTLGSDGGAFEAFAYDIRNLKQPRFFASEDDEQGCLRRWTPTNPVWGMDPWPMLHGPGVTEYLILQPNDASGGNAGTFYWTTNEKSARDNAKQYYRYSEGIEVQGSFLYFVIKGDYRLFTLNLDAMTYTSVSTRAGLFDGEPDQINAILQEDGTTRLYFSEDWGKVAGIHARDQYGNIETILEGPQYSPETTGIAFSPDGKRMYFTFQENGVMFELTRDDGFSFHGRTVNLKPRHTDNPATYRRRK